MLKSLEELAGFQEHEDEAVAERVAEILAGAGKRSPIDAEQLLEWAQDKQTHRRLSVLLSNGRDLRQSQGFFDRLWHGIENIQAPREWRSHLMRALFHLDEPLLRENRAKLDNYARLGEKDRKELNARLRLTEASTEQLVEKLLDVCHELDEGDWDIDKGREEWIQRGRWIARAIADRTGGTGKLIDDAVSWAREKDAEGWRSVLGMMVAGRSGRIGELMDCVVSTLEDSDLYYNSEGREWLSTLHSPAEVESLVAMMLAEAERSSDEFVPVFAGEVLEKIRTPEAETGINCLLDLELNGRNRLHPRMFLPYSAANMIPSVPTLERVRDLILEGKAVQEVTETMEAVCVASVVADWPFAEREAWLKQLTDEYVAAAERSAKRMAQLGLPAKPQERIKPLETANAVGRNDPCTCGSGKKHKKCCGK